MSTALLNETKYAELLSQTRPRVIRNDKELDRFTGILLELDEIASPTREQRELVGLLTTLVEQYESEHYSLPTAKPIEVIKFLLEQRGQTAKALWPVLGSKGTTSEILSGKRNVGITTAAKLGKFFQVAPELFVDWNG